MGATSVLPKLSFAIGRKKQSRSPQRCPIVRSSCVREVKFQKKYLLTIEDDYVSLFHHPRKDRPGDGHQ
jgi:hypothetical protein